MDLPAEYAYALLLLNASENMFDSWRPSMATDRCFPSISSQVRQSRIRLSSPPGRDNKQISLSLALRGTCLSSTNPHRCWRTRLHSHIRGDPLCLANACIVPSKDLRR